MCDQSVPQPNENRKPLSLVPAKVMRERTSTSRTREHANIKGGPGADPDWPRPVYRDGRIYYVSAEVDRYIDRVIERGRDNQPPMHERLAVARGLDK
jgi:hypothetical protein